MGKNSDTYNIFDSYYNNVLLNEAADVPLNQIKQRLKVALNDPTTPPAEKQQYMKQISYMERYNELPEELKQSETSTSSTPTATPTPAATVNQTTQSKSGGISLDGVNYPSNPSAPTATPSPATPSQPKAKSDDDFQKKLDND